jgi:YidC/Oxa1 family membrane protein insertase
MSQEKRALIAAVLSFAVLLAWYLWWGPKNLTPPPEIPAVVSPEPPAEKKEKETGADEKVGGAPLPEKAVVKETPLVAMTWTNRGGGLREIRIKGYRETVDSKSPLINLLPFEGEKALPLLCDGCNFPLPAEENYAVSRDEEGKISFEGEREGVAVGKSYEWKGDQYLFNVKVVVQNKTDRELRGRLGVGWRARQHPEPPKGMFSFLKGPGNQRSFIYNLGGKIVRNGKEELQEFRGAIPWVGIQDRYFLISLVSRRVSSEQLLRLRKSGEWLEFSLYPTEAVLAPQSRHEETYSFYLGPQEREALKVAGVGLEEAIDYGWFEILAIPILKLLQVFHATVKNWGIAIILLTVFVKLLMNPLTVKSMKQMKEMQNLQPQLAALKEKYKNDRQRLNMETMQLFRTHKVNPMGGCLPILLQMPIYIALYKVLYNSIELYHAPFFGFYRDLSAPDPYFILPILLGISMVAQQKLTPSASVDPAQRQMMMIMPVMFTAFMLFLPLGLVVYIFVNTVMSVIQQWMYQKGIRWRDVFRGLKIAS